MMNITRLTWTCGALVVAVIGFNLLSFVDATPLAEPIDWNEVLSDPQGKLPDPQPKVIWRENLTEALAEARRTGRPLFVTFRCLPCKQCLTFDQEVLEGGPQLDPFLKQFITVRITNAEHMDLRLFPAEGFQDLDLSWWGYFLSNTGQLYAIFGGKDHVSDQTRISVAALANTMQRVLSHHYDPRRKKWDVDGPTPDLTRPVKRPDDLPGYASWNKQHPAERRECMHCHHVVEILRQPALDAGKFNKKRDVYTWPLPENVGLTLDRDHGLKVTNVQPGSPAAVAGIRPGDTLAAAEGHRLFGQADFRGVLHRGPQGAGAINYVYWRRGDQIHSANLKVNEGWRQTVLDWRMSVSQGNIGAGPAFWPLPGPRNGIEKGKMSIRPYFGKNTDTPAYKAGLRPNHTVIAANGKSPDLHGRAFLVWFRLQTEPGDPVTLTIREPNGRTRDITYKTIHKNH